MEKLIFKKFFIDTINFLIIGTLSLTLIVWVIQAVNYLDFVSEDGHSFKIYFLYTLLNFPKIFSKLFIFMIFITIFYTVNKYEENNELTIFWTNGIKKKEFINLIIKFSLFLVIIQLLLNLFLVPKTQDLARSFIRASNVDYFPSLMKSKKFISVVEDLTLFIDKKNEDGDFENIFLKESKLENSSQIISAKKGSLKKINNEYFLTLFQGNIIDKNEDNINIISYDKTRINLSNYTTKTTTYPKIQELNTSLLIKCLIKVFKFNEPFKTTNLTCNKRSAYVIIEEMYKRLIVPFYIIIVSIIGSSLIINSGNENSYTNKRKYIFILGIIFIILSQILSQYSSDPSLKNFSFVISPFLIATLFYSIIQIKLKE